MYVYIIMYRVYSIYVVICLHQQGFPSQDRACQSNSHEILQESFLPKLGLDPDGHKHSSSTYPPRKIWGKILRCPSTSMIFDIGKWPLFRDSSQRFIAPSSSQQLKLLGSRIHRWSHGTSRRALWLSWSSTYFAFCWAMTLCSRFTWPSHHVLSQKLSQNSSKNEKKI